MRQGRICERLLAAGHAVEELAAMRFGDLPSDDDQARCVELRGALDLPASEDSPAFVLADGRPLDAAGLDRYLRVARLIRVSIEGNASACRSLLQTRYDLTEVAA